MDKQTLIGVYLQIVAIALQTFTWNQKNPKIQFTDDVLVSKLVSELVSKLVSQ